MECWTIVFRKFDVMSCDYGQLDCCIYHNIWSQNVWPVASRFTLLQQLASCSSWATSVVTINSIGSAGNALSCCDKDSNNCTKYHTSDVKFPKRGSRITTLVQHSSPLSTPAHALYHGIVQNHKSRVQLNSLLLWKCIRRYIVMVLLFNKGIIVGRNRTKRHLDVHCTVKQDTYDNKTNSYPNLNDLDYQVNLKLGHWWMR